MMKVGKNIYKWPIKDYVLWYDYDEVVSLIPAPKPVTKRHVLIEPMLWSMIVDVVDRSQEIDGQMNNEQVVPYCQQHWANITGGD